MILIALFKSHEDIPETQPCKNCPDIYLIRSFKLSLAYLYHFYDFRYLPLGIPLQFYLAWGPCPPGVSCSESNLFDLAIDILFWYILSAFLVSKLVKASP